MHQWLKSLVHEVMVYSLELFQNPSFVVVTLSTAMEVFNPRAKGKKTFFFAKGMGENAEDNVMELKY